MTEKKLSGDQKKIINNLDKYNVAVNAVAGCGKTTTILYVAREYPDLNILLLTYNTRLKMETKQKRDDMEITNLEVHSYHSMVHKYYNDTSHTDKIINETVKQNIKPKRPIKKYNIIVLDEVQDMSILYYLFVYKLIRDTKTECRLCVLGDNMQSIFEFNGADDRFIIYASDIFNGMNNFGWQKVNLKTTFRLTDKIAAFLNECVLKEDRLTAVKSSEHKVRYIICDCYEKYKTDKPQIIREIYRYLDMGYKRSDIFILAPSIRSKSSPCRIIANYLSLMEKIPIYVSLSDDDKLEDSVMKDKIVFATYHQTKGLERKIVIVFGFDNSYFTYYKTTSDPNICPNEIYVATTRAMECMTVIHSRTFDYLPFLDKAKIFEQCDVIESHPLDIKKRNNLLRPEYKYSITDLVRHLPYSTMETTISRYLDITDVSDTDDSKKINIKPITATHNEYCESVSEITGTAIPAYYEFITKKRISIFEELKDPNNDIHYRIQNRLEGITYENMTISKILKIATCYCAHVSGYLFKIEQINKYDWIDKTTMNRLIERFRRVISGDAVYEVKTGNEKINGIIDCIDGDKIYEIKCTEKTDQTHFLQLALYMHTNGGSIRAIKNYSTKVIYLGTVSNCNMHSINYDTKTVLVDINRNIKNIPYSFDDIMLDKWVGPEIKKYISESPQKHKYYVFNVITNEIYEIKSTPEKLKELSEYIFVNKTQSKKQDYSDFMREIEMIKKNNII